MIKLGELVMILDLHRQGLSVSAIARQVGIDRKTVRTYIAKGLEPPAYKKRPPAPGLVDGFEPYLRERLAAYPALTGRRLFREMKERGFSGGYSVVRDRVREIRPVRSIGYETRFETPPGEQAQVDFARFEVEFTDEPGVNRIVWLFSRCSGTPADLGAVRPPPGSAKRSSLPHHGFRGDRGRAAHHPLRSHETAVIGEDADGLVSTTRARRPARHYGLQPRACRPYPAKTKGKVERLRRDNQDENCPTIRMRQYAAAGISKEGRSPTVDIPAAAASAKVASSAVTAAGLGIGLLSSRGPTSCPADTSPIVR